MRQFPSTEMKVRSAQRLVEATKKMQIRSSLKMFLFIVDFTVNKQRPSTLNETTVISASDKYTTTFDVYGLTDNVADLSLLNGNHL